MIAIMLVPGLLTLGGCATTGGGSQSAVLRAKDRVFPALVHIRPVKEVYTRGQREEVLVIGSGFIISPDGYVITNEHVAGESRFVHCVLSDKSEVEAEVVGVDTATDIAVIKLQVDRKLPFVELGNSDRIEAGQTVIALGSPHGLARSVSLGIVSVTDRYLDSGNVKSAPYNNFIQTDAAINPGNSGGPLVDLQGRVIGVNARVLRGAENVGFAIPINVASEVADDLIQRGSVERAWLGIEVQEMLSRTDDASQRGVLIADIDPLSPSAEAGVMPGDILIAMNGLPVNARFEEDLPAVRKHIADLPVGQPAHLALTRQGEDVLIEVVPEEKGASRGTEAEFKKWGFTVSELTPEIVRRAQLPSRDGVLVSGTQVGGVAHNARLSRGDIILRVDDEDILNLAGFRAIYDARVASAQERILLLVKRGALTRYVMIKQNAETGEGDTDAE